MPATRGTLPASRGLAELGAGGAGAVLVAGSAARSADALAAAGSRSPIDRDRPAGERGAVPARVAIDTGVAGIHEGGTAYRMDEVPLPLRPPLAGARSAADTLAALLGAVRARRAGRTA